MTPQIDAAQARAWLSSIPGNVNEIYEPRWKLFSEYQMPVVTLYGAYDTGKSSLLRRLIVDFGGAVPEWLTISARHETFEVNEVELAGCTVRDTPGFVPSAADVRADLNTELAGEAISLTDVGIVVLTPQLATAEYATLLKLVGSGWPGGALWFVISRFDEAGIDPESDLDGYRDLAARKTVELRAALNLEQEVPVYVVCQDLAQMAGAERDPGTDFWDQSRAWDGMAQLASAVNELGKTDWSDLRAASEQRFWRSAVESSLVQLNSEIATYEERKSACLEGLDLRNSWTSQLDDLRVAAEADLRGRVSEITGEAVYDAAAARLIGDTLTAVLDTWYRDQERKVHKFLQSVLSTASVERTRPSWKRVHEFAKSMHGQNPKPSSSKKEGEFFTPAAERVADAVAKAFVDYQKLSRLTNGAEKDANKKQDSINQNVAAAGAVVVVEVVRIAEKLYNRRAEDAAAAQERARLEQDLNRLGQQTATVAVEALQPLLDEARASINEATAEQVDMLDGLEKTIDGLQERIAEANAFLTSSC